MLDKIEEVAMRFAGRCYLFVAIASFVYILWRSTWDVCLAATIAIIAFVFYCVIDPDKLAPDDDDDDQ